MRTDRGLGAAPFSVLPDDVRRPDVLALLADHVTELRSLSPPESCHVLDVERLDRPTVRFLTVREGDGLLVACGAWQDLGAGHGELKSMRTASAHRGRGGAGLLVDALIADARRSGLRRLSLETGSAPFFGAARRLYERHGFRPCPPFGDYAEHPDSVFLTREV